jgi:hypothetical protein
VTVMSLPGRRTALDLLEQGSGLLTLGAGSVQMAPGWTQNDDGDDQGASERGSDGKASEFGTECRGPSEEL